MEGRAHHYPSSEPELWRFYMDWHKAERHPGSFEYRRMSQRWHDAQAHLSRLWASMQYQQTERMLKRTL